MTDEELKKKCTERAKIFQQAMESCHSSSPIDCIEWFADRIVELEKRCANYEMTISKMEKGTCDICKETEKDNRIVELEKACDETQELLDKQIEATYKLDKENAELKTKVTALENANRAMVKELDDTTSGGLNILQNVVKNKEELVIAKEIISEYVRLANLEKEDTVAIWQLYHNAEQFLKDCEGEK